MGGPPPPPGPPHCFRLRRYGRRIFRPNFFVGRSGGTEPFLSFQKICEGKFFEMVSWGGLGGLAPPGISVTRALPPGGGLGGFAPQDRSGRALPPCLAPNFFFRPIFFRPNFFVRIFSSEFFCPNFFRPIFSSVVRPSSVRPLHRYTFLRRRHIFYNEMKSSLFSK